MNTKIDDESKIEFKLPQKDGNVASINISTGKQEWIKEFDANSSSLGLIVKGDKMYFFTMNSVYQLSSE